MLSTLKTRLREPSTWAGIGALIAAAGHAATTMDPQAIGACVAGILAMLLPERGPK